MHYGKINKYDIANGPGVRVSLFVSGCRNACKGCFNPEAWDFNYGNEFTESTINEISMALLPDHISGLSILGGEPMEPENQKDLFPFIKYIRQIHPNKTIWVYTGYTFESLCNNSIPNITFNILELIDVLVDGRFDESKKDISLSFRGSRNQRIINIPETFKRYNDLGHLVLMDQYMNK